MPQHVGYVDKVRPSRSRSAATGRGGLVGYGARRRQSQWSAAKAGRGGRLARPDEEARRRKQKLTPGGSGGAGRARGERRGRRSGVRRSGDGGRAVQAQGCAMGTCAGACGASQMPSTPPRQLVREAVQWKAARKSHVARMWGQLAGQAKAPAAQVRMASAGPGSLAVVAAGGRPRRATRIPKFRQGHTPHT
jgi:hypothetical protein